MSRHGSEGAELWMSALTDGLKEMNEQVLGSFFNPSQIRKNVLGTLGFLITLVPDKPTRTAPLSAGVHRFSDKVLTVLQRSGSRVTCWCFLL